MTTEPTWSGSAGPTAVGPAGRVAPGTARVEAFSDGVLAVAITLLVLAARRARIGLARAARPVAGLRRLCHLVPVHRHHVDEPPLLVRDDRASGPQAVVRQPAAPAVDRHGAVQHVAGGGVPHPPRLQRQDRYGHLQRAVVPDGAGLRGAVGVSVDPPAPACGWGRRGGGAACVPAVRDRLGRVRGPGGGVVPQPCGRAGVACVSGRLLRLRTTPGRAARRWPSRLSCRGRRPAPPSLSCAVAQLRRLGTASVGSGRFWRPGCSGTTNEGATRSTVAARWGSHQLALPKMATSAGTSSARTRVASSKMPTPRPVAKTLMSVPGEDAKATKDRNRISAADVTSRPVLPRPSTTARLVEPVASYSSRIRARMKTS